MHVEQLADVDDATFNEMVVTRLLDKMDVHALGQIKLNIEFMVEKKFLEPLPQNGEPLEF